MSVRPAHGWIALIVLMCLALVGCAVPDVPTPPPATPSPQPTSAPTKAPTEIPTAVPITATLPAVTVASVTPELPPTQVAGGSPGVSAGTAIAITAGPAITVIPGGPTPTSPPTPSQPGTSLTITQADNGKTISLQVGQEFLLYLGMENFIWTVTIENPDIVSRVMGVMPIRGAQGIFRANKPGQTALSAIGDPPCRQSVPPCMMPSLAFQVELVVH